MKNMFSQFRTWSHVDDYLLSSISKGLLATKTGEKSVSATC